MQNRKPMCFVIAPIGDKDSPTRKRSDQVLRHVIKKALSEQYEVTRADDLNAPGMITSQVLRAVQDSDLVVADLTEHNPNVFYELAVRHAVEKPIIHIIEPLLSEIPFDVGGFRTIQFNHNDLDSVDDAVNQLQQQAEEAKSGNWGETPIKIANVLQPTHEDSAQMLLLKEAVEGIANVSARLSNLESRPALNRASFDPWTQRLNQLLNPYSLTSQELRAAQEESEKLARQYAKQMEAAMEESEKLARQHAKRMEAEQSKKNK